MGPFVDRFWILGLVVRRETIDRLALILPNAAKPMNLCNVQACPDQNAASARDNELAGRGEGEFFRET